MATNTPAETPETKCFSCQVDDKRAAGEPVTQQEMNHWSMWGCTCDPQVPGETRRITPRSSNR